MEDFTIHVNDFNIYQISPVLAHKRKYNEAL
jgi:hypothetical protein